ncbi:hypothetical protein AB0H49_33825 [Nocardia sp. NPDC050713]|uniref:hypothetical protein n=1 Tax=Nocardia sp. NPDC050713 TaxID=3154511 RepID=UPI00340C2483
MFSVTLTFADAAAVIGVLLLCLVIWAAVFASDPDRREAAQRVLAMFSRHKHIPTVQAQPINPPPPAGSTSSTSRSRRRARRS